MEGRKKWINSIPVVLIWGYGLRYICPVSYTHLITILLMIEDIDATIISRVLDVDQATVTRHKYLSRIHI